MTEHLRLPHQSPRHVSQKGPQDHFLLQSAGDEQIDFVRPDRFQDREGRIFALVIMNRRILRQRQLEESRGKLAARLLIAFSQRK